MVLRVATPRSTSQVGLPVSPSHVELTPGQTPVALTLTRGTVQGSHLSTRFEVTGRARSGLAGERCPISRSRGPCHRSGKARAKTVQPWCGKAGHSAVRGKAGMDDRPVLCVRVLSVFLVSYQFHCAERLVYWRDTCSLVPCLCVCSLVYDARVGPTAAFSCAG